MSLLYKREDKLSKTLNLKLSKKSVIKSNATKLLVHQAQLNWTEQIKLQKHNNFLLNF